jgi:hypothetical protein
MTPQQVASTIALVDSAIDVVLPVVGQPELVPIADALAALAQKVNVALAQKSAAAAAAAEVKAADVAADAAELAKFGAAK